MNNHHQNIESYLLGELRGQDLLDFNEALNHDVELAEAVAKQREMMQRFEAYRIRSAIKSATTALRIPWWRNPAARWTGLALILCTILTLIWFGYPTAKVRPSEPAPSTPHNLVAPSQTEPTHLPEPSKLTKEAPPKSQKANTLIALAHEYYASPNQTQIRSIPKTDPANAQPTLAEQARQAFANKNFRKAAELLRSDKNVWADENARFTRANARFQLDQFQGAAQDFAALTSSFQYKFDAQWGYVLSQLALGNTALTKSRLEQMAADSDFPFQDKATELLSRVPHK